MQEIPKTYDQRKEPDIYKLWEMSGYFNPDNLAGEPFTITMPPPNVTGDLHVGHALFLTLQDILIRFERMRGRKTLWLPGTDHAAIATQSKVEADLYKQEGKTRFDLGREEFLKKVETYAQAKHDNIIQQIRRMGSSCDWSREAYTLDEQRTLAVRTAFKKMYDDGLIYRGKRIVNWDPKLKTTVSDDEVEWKEETVPFYYLKYGPFVIGTARPETKFGDKFVVMHPQDKRYKDFKHGQTMEVDWINGKVTATIIKDEAVDREFGTGVMTITPWHDAADFEIAQRHNLDFEQIIDFDGKLLPIAGKFAGQHIKKARPLIVEALKQKGLIEKIDENYVHRIATNSRGGGIIEPQILSQWFVSVNKQKQFERNDKWFSLKKLMHDPVANGKIKIIPERFKKIYFHWIDNLRDWCISRQIWYGHRIPVWYCNKEKANLPHVGIADFIVEQLLKGKTKTYRLRNYGLKVGDKVLFENTQTRTVFGAGEITGFETKKIKDIPLDDKAHYSTYTTLDELLAAFKRHYPPDRKIDGDTTAYLYTYTFEPFSQKNTKDGCGQIIVSTEEPKNCPVCKNHNLIQDPDTLDTWFSSGLWTFSTLGWPKETQDLKTFHPTDVLETGYDILFFWVARMILMSTYLLSEIPFKTVYLHGLIRDKDRQKMSKTKGNVIDPLGIIDTYGSDALRMGLVVGNLPGNDLPLSEDKIRGYRNFANKVWNAARFVLQNTDELTRLPSQAKFGGQVNELTTDSQPIYRLNKEDKKILADLDKFAKSITKKLEKFDIAHAAEDLYHYFWHTFADKIIEESKAKLADEKKRASAQLMLKTMLETLLKLLHPFMPFVTEAVWQLEHKELLMIQKWPK